MLRRKQLLALLKWVISGALLYFIFTKIAFHEVSEILTSANLAYLIAALLFFFLSKAIAAFRLYLYLHKIGATLSHKSNLRLYLLGMFYNLFLPGGIGGDAYKGYVIKKRFQIATKKVVAALVLDRLNGLHLLVTYACALALFLDLGVWSAYQWLPIPLALVATIAFWLVQRTVLRETLPLFWKATGFSALVQLAQLISVFFILKALAIDTATVGYLFVFLVSSIVAVIPLTIGGIGSRELTFYYGSDLLGLHADSAIGVSMLFFMITAFVSLFGIVYHFNRTAMEETGTSKDTP